MKENTVIFTFNDVNIEFEFSKDSDVMVNATQMIKAFPDKRMSDFLENKTTKNFLNACLKNGNSRFLNVNSIDELYTSKQKTGTWMHRFLAYKFAAWLSPDFELWVYSKIDVIIMGFYKNIKASLKESAVRVIEMQGLEQKLLLNDDFKRLEGLRKEEARAKRNRTKAQKEELTKIQETVK